MQPENEYYRDFTEDDFLADPFFQDWVLAPSDAKDAYWKKLQLQYPDKPVMIQNARQLLTQLRFLEEFPSDALVQEKYLAYQQRITVLQEQDPEYRNARPQTDVSHKTGNLHPVRQESVHQHDIVGEHIDSAETLPIKPGIRSWSGALKVAAVLTGLILISYLIIQLTNSATTKSWSTAYGEQQTIYLPDSSLVVLNSKSQVRISNWKNNQPREVWLEGEAYFDVKHINKEGSVTERVPFTVHTKQVEIDVLGTAFDVRERRGLTEVVLQRGLINIKTRATESGVMHPGDRIVYEPSANKLDRSKIDVTDYLKWREKKLLLVDPTAGEICKYLEDNFGKKIVFEDSALQHKKIEGPIMINNLDDALFVISTVLNTKISKNDSVIIFRTK